MQVADMQNKSTSASLGAGETLAVSMVEDAAFLMMLSSNLYSNQLLAAIREPLCNAWDANIEAGTTDQPLKISITTDGELIIQDNGLGIPPEKIAQIYGTYGASTKRNDSKTTGGFGLGSKAPWALVDAFRVTSEYNGTKTVYNMARSVVENQGKPGITPMVSVPTSRSGLTVSFRLTLDQAQTAHTYLKYLVMHGEMNAELSWMGGEFEPMAKLGISDEDAELILAIREASDIKITTPETKAESPAKPEGKAMTVKEQAQELYRVFKETKAKGNRADTKDAAGELQFFMSSRKKGPKAFGLDPKVSDELKTWLK